VFSTGFSFGGMMSYAVGCAGLARAIAPMAGNNVSGCENGNQPVAMMGFHGDDDTTVTIDGGRRSRDVFVQRNQCMEQTMPAASTYCDGVSQTNQPCTCVSYQGCAAGYPVTWCEFNGPHTPAPNSAATIWNFFSGF
jgi:poly(3-hydroxybutyrate) depolymerase